MIDEMIDEMIEPTVKETKEEKWSRECLTRGFKYIGKSSEKNAYAIVECQTCGHVDSYRRDRMRKGEVRCNNCLITKYSNECLTQGFKYIGKSSEDSDYTIAECNVCGHVDSYTQNNIRNGEVRCNNCLSSRYSNECLAQGFKFIRKIDKQNSLVECLTCSYIDSYRQSHMRLGNVRCENCLTTKYSNECLANGFKYLGKSSENSNSTIAECLTCSHVDTYQQTNIRNGNVRCSNCLINKYKASVKPGWEYVDKSRIKNMSHIILKHNCSDNLVTVQIGNFLDGAYDCPHCMHSHFDEQSNFYVIKVSNEEHSLIKVGVANNTDKRFGQYGLPDDATLEIIHVKTFDTKRLAIAFESMVKDTLKEYKLDDDIAKSIFTESGHTEVFSTDSLDIIRQLI